MKSFGIILAVCLVAVSADLLWNEGLSCDGNRCTGQITYGYFPLDLTLVTKFAYNSNAAQVTSTVIRQKNGYGQTVYSRVPLANGTRTRQCVDLLYGNDELCVIFHSTANATNADVKLHYRATTKSFGTEQTYEREVFFTPNDSSKN